MITGSVHIRPDLAALRTELTIMAGDGGRGTGAGAVGPGGGVGAVGVGPSGRTGPGGGA